MSSAAIIPAAGASRRMGFPKLLIRIEGKTLIERAIETARAAGCDPVVVVVGGGPPEIATLARAAGARVVANPRWEEGLGASIAAGASALPPQVEAVLVLPGDQFGVEVSHLESLLHWVHQHGGVAATQHEEMKGAPAAFAGASVGLLRELRGDRGAQAAVQESKGFAPPKPIRDFDTPSDLAVPDVS